MFENKDYELWQGDCLELMKDIPDKSVDMIFTDLPYGTTHCKWDSIIPLDELWTHYKRIIKDNHDLIESKVYGLISNYDFNEVKEEIYDILCDSLSKQLFGK